MMLWGASKKMTKFWILFPNFENLYSKWWLLTVLVTRQKLRIKKIVYYQYI